VDGFEVRLLLDTHIWFWSLVEPSKLSRRVRAAVKRAENALWLSPISVWETLALAERGRVRLDSEPRAWVVEALGKTPVQEATLNFEVAVRSREILPSHRDPADRFLVATALVYDLTLVTADEILLKAKVCEVLANR
jgi:PIN domain nuclease of toxin-antitoxin system